MLRTNMVIVLFVLVNFTIFFSLSYFSITINPWHGLIFYIFISILDIHSTHIALSSQVGVEKNKFVAYAISSFGFKKSMVLKMILVICISFPTVYVPNERMFSTMLLSNCILTSLVAINNYTLILRSKFKAR